MATPRPQRPPTVNRVLRAVQAAAAPRRPAEQLETVAFTALDPVEDTFPISVSLASGMSDPPREVRILRARADPDAAWDVPATLDWAPGVGGTVDIRRVGGIRALVAYELDLLIVGT